MTSLRSQARELLDSARNEHTPSAADRARVIRALLDAAAQTAAHHAQPPPLAKRLSSTAKLLLLAALVLLIVGAIHLVSQLGQR
jgi:hypothetical protein